MSPIRRRRTARDVAQQFAEAIEGRRYRWFGGQLRRWYRQNARDLPWRNTRDPYAILVSELMLQQTQVSRVVDYYARFLARFPSLSDVAQAPIAHVLEEWQGLGYYARARNLHKLAGTLTDGGATRGTMPREPDALRALPGIGAYTAGAVATFAYEKRAALVDTNVARVLLRFFAPAYSPKSGAGQQMAWALAERALPARGGRTTWEHNQALMELGALVCTARVARCDACALLRRCASGVPGGFTKPPVP